MSENDTKKRLDRGITEQNLSIYVILIKYSNYCSECHHLNFKQYMINVKILPENSIVFFGIVGYNEYFCETEKRYNCV